MKLLIVGGGGREHALAWKCAQSPLVERVFVAPGNAGTAREPKVENVPIGAEDITHLIAFAREQGLGLTVVGPELPLACGIVDAFAQAGLRCLGPRREAALLEASKAFAKDFCRRHGIPTARYAVFTDPDQALAYLEAHPLPAVIKADGLAAGKGVVIAEDYAQAAQAVRQMLEGGRYGEAGRRLVIEEFLEGEEASFIVLTDGRSVLPLASSQDHKRLLEADRGPNTGGMGAYSPAPVVTTELHARILREVIEPAVAGMSAEGRPYVGVLYAGLMIAADGSPRVLEFNCRLGDPEAQPILMRLRSDLVTLCLAALEGRLAAQQVQWDPRAALAVVLAAEGYPGAARKGDPIRGLDPGGGCEDTVKVFHAGTSLRDGEVVTAGGRVLCVCALGETVAEAQRRAYARIERIAWPGMHYRRDIGHRALSRASCPL